MSGVWHVNLCFWRSWQGCKEKTPGEGAEECFFTGTKNTEGQTKRKKGFWGKGGWWKSRGSLLFISLFNRSVVSDSLPPHKLQHARLPCRLLSPWVCTNSCPLSQWCHPTISSSVPPFSSCLQSFPASESFPVRRLFVSSGQSRFLKPTETPKSWPLIVHFQEHGKYTHTETHVLSSWCVRTSCIPQVCPCPPWLD